MEKQDFWGIKERFYKITLLQTTDPMFDALRTLYIKASGIEAGKSAEELETKKDIIKSRNI